MKKLQYTSKVVVLLISSHLLAACDTIDRISRLRNDPIMKVQHGMTREQVQKIVGLPVEENALQYPSATCLEYVTHTRDPNDPIQHVIVLNSEGLVSHIYTDSNCRSYAQKQTQK
jgi:outer membrane protein assembly factor BamE (lipoprotein component of BamABCDE complex)